MTKLGSKGVCIKLILNVLKSRFNKLLINYSERKLNENKLYLNTNDYCKIIYSRDNIYFKVNVDEVVTPNQFFFSKNKWHYHTKTVEQLINYPSLEYKDSILYKYYSIYKPENLYDFYFSHKDPIIISKKETELLNQDINLYLQNSPWSDKRQKVDFSQVNEKGLNRLHGVQHYGPVSAEKGTLEFNRLKNTYKSIACYGYKPEKFGYIKGYFLKYKEKYRFVISNGIHRAAVLAALNYNNLPVSFEQNFPKVLDYKDICNFPLVKEGIFTQQLSEQIFISYFDGNGLEKAKKLGFIS